MSFIKCPKCGNPRIKYLEENKNKTLTGKSKGDWKRSMFYAKCNKCKFEGEVF